MSDVVPVGTTIPNSLPTENAPDATMPNPPTSPDQNGLDMAGETEQEFQSAIPEPPTVEF